MSSNDWVTSADGTPIAVHHFGGDGPPMIVCHATGFHAHCYLPLASTFAEHFSVWGVDLRAHGQSQIDPEATLDWDDFVEDFLAAVDHITDAPIPAFGHSMGGATILKAEAKRPGTIARAYVYEPIIFPAEIGPKNSMMAANASKRRAEFPSKAEALARYASRPPLNSWRADALHAYVEHGFIDTDDGTTRLACLPRFEAMTFETADTGVDAVADVQTPVVVARGEINPEVPGAVDFAAGAAAGIPNAVLEPHDGIGHFGPFEAPDLIAGATLDWLLERGVG